MQGGSGGTRHPLGDVCSQTAGHLKRYSPYSAIHSDVKLPHSLIVGLIWSFRRDESGGIPLFVLLG